MLLESISQKKYNFQNKNPTIKLGLMYGICKLYKKEHFDVILNLFTSFGYFNSEKEDFETIQTISKNLKNKGILIIDFFNSKKIISNLVETEQKTLSGITFKINRKVEKGFILKNIQFKDRGKKFEFTEKVKALKLSDFTKLLNFKPT